MGEPVKRSVYHKDVPTVCPWCKEAHMVTIDVYAVLRAFKVTSQTIGHAIKKLLLPGQRSGGKSEAQDVAEAIWTLQRHYEIEAQHSSSYAPAPGDAPRKDGER